MKRARGKGERSRMCGDLEVGFDYKWMSGIQIDLTFLYIKQQAPDFTYGILFSENMFSAALYENASMYK